MARSASLLKFPVPKSVNASNIDPSMMACTVGRAPDVTAQEMASRRETMCFLEVKANRGCHFGVKHLIVFFRPSLEMRPAFERLASGNGFGGLVVLTADSSGSADSDMTIARSV